MLLCGVFALSLVFASMICRSLDVIGKSRRDSSEVGGVLSKSAEFSLKSAESCWSSPRGLAVGSELARSCSEVGGVILDSF